MLLAAHSLHVSQENVIIMNVAPDPGSCTRDICGHAAGPGFLFPVHGPAPAAHYVQRTVKPPGGFFSHHGLLSMAAAAYVTWSLTKEPVMGGMACIIPGRAAGVLANMLIPGRRSWGFGVTCVIGAAGGLLGGWAATRRLPARPWSPGLAARPGAVRLSPCSWARSVSWRASWAPRPSSWAGEGSRRCRGRPGGSRHTPRGLARIRRQPGLACVLPTRRPGE
jgi:hypothetical protein